MKFIYCKELLFSWVIWLIVLLLTDKYHICTNLFMFDFLQFLFRSSGKCPNCIIYPLLILKSLIYIYHTDLTSICHIQFFKKKGCLYYVYVIHFSFIIYICTWILYYFSLSKNVKYVLYSPRNVQYWFPILFNDSIYIYNAFIVHNCAFTWHQLLMFTTMFAHSVSLHCSWVFPCHFALLNLMVSYSLCGL